MGHALVSKRHFKQQRDLIGWLSNNPFIREHLNNIFHQEAMHLLFQGEYGGFWLEDEVGATALRIVRKVERLLWLHKQQCAAFVEELCSMQFQAGILKYDPDAELPTPEDFQRKVDECATYYLTMMVKMLKGEVVITIHDLEVAENA